MNWLKIQETFDLWLRHLERQNNPNEWEIKQLLAKLGIGTPKGIMLRASEADIRGIESRFSGMRFPFAVKVCSPWITHKSDRNGVLLNIAGEGLRSAIQEIERQFPECNILVEEMVSFESGEFIIGLINDSTFGPAIMVGAGGVHTELYRDTAFRLAPCADAEAARMLNELSIAPVLHGYRGSSHDADALAGVVSSISRLAVTTAQSGYQMDINPIVWTGTQWMVLDAVMTQE